MLDEGEFPVAHGIRAYLAPPPEGPVVFDWVARSTGPLPPAESDTGMFGGNSNWRGPVWFPMNLVILRRRWSSCTATTATGEGRKPRRLGSAGSPSARWPLSSPAASHDVHRRQNGTPPMSARTRVPERPPLPRPGPVLRVFPRRDRRRPRRQPPDRLDRTVALPTPDRGGSAYISPTNWRPSGIEGGDDRGASAHSWRSGSRRVDSGRWCSPAAAARSGARASRRPNGWHTGSPRAVAPARSSCTTRITACCCGK